MAKVKFVHLHNHSEYSLLDGAFRIADLVRAAAENGMEAVALTDHGNLFGAIPFYKEAKASSIKPIIGMEAYIAQGSMRDRTREGGRVINDHLTILVKDEKGYKNLIKLSSIAFLEGFYYKPRLDLETLASYSEGLIALSGCLQGGIPRLLLAGKEKEAKDLAGKFRDIFGDGNFYLEIQNHGIEEELTVIPLIARLSKETGIPLVATNDCHFWKAEHHKAHDVLLALQTGRDIDDASRVLRSNPETYFKSPEQMFELFKEFPEAIKNTVAIAERCNFELKFGGYHLPKFPIPDGFNSADEYLEHLVMENLPSRIPEAGEEVFERVKYELSVISRMNFAGYFLVVWDIVNAAKRMGVPVGPGRGSAAGSLVCYLLGITDINPLEHGLLFERLLNPERVSMPDIDVDFSDERRQDVIDYVIKRYGKENVCQIITFGRMAEKSAIRDVARVLKIPLSEADKVAKSIQSGTTISKAIESIPELKERYSRDAKFKEWMDLSMALEGIARHASTHAAGIVITPDELTNYIPLFRTNKGEVTTQYEMKILEEIGILKIDILGLKTLSQIEKTINLVERHYGEKIKIEEIPLEDKATFELLCRGQTAGIFQLESSGMRDLLRRIEPSKFEDIVAVNALYRPGPLGSDMVSDFIECKHGRKKVTYEDPRLEPILKETYGVILYQEQVMRIANELSGFSLGQADILRRAMGKKQAAVMEKQRDIFVSGAVERGVQKKKAKKIFDLMANFAGYGFNKSHSAAYAMITYRTAYLKAHYPDAFMAATMSCEMNDTTKLLQFLDECRNMGIPVQPPDVNVGRVEFDLAYGEITYGLAAIKNVGVQAIEAIIRAREDGGAFSDLFDFCERVDLRQVNRRVIENLIQSGAMDSLGATRAELMANLDRAIKDAQRIQEIKRRGQTSLGLIDEGPGIGARKLERVEEWDESTKLSREKESLGFYFSGHPLDRFGTILKALINFDSRKIEDNSSGKSITALVLINDLKVVVDRKGNPMAFVSVEDIYGTFEVIAFSDCYSKYRKKLQKDNVVLIKGKYSSRGRSKKSIIADDVYLIDEAVRQLPRRVHIYLRHGRFGIAEVERLKIVCNKHIGEKEIVFHFRENGRDKFVVISRGIRVESDLELLDELSSIKGVEDVELSI